MRYFIPSIDVLIKEMALTSHMKRFCGCVLQYKIRCFLMLKSLKSCKREMKALVGSQGPVSLSVSCML